MSHCCGRKKRHPHKYPLENYVLNPDRAVLPVELLYKVGKARYDRTLARSDVLAKMAEDPKRRTRLGGKNKTQDGCYRHKHGVKCGSTNRSIKRDILEADFGRLLELLWVNPEQIEAMTLLNLSALGGKHSMQFQRGAGSREARRNRKMQSPD